MIIAFSSNFIPRLVYMSVASPDHTDTGFLNHSLAYFDTRDFKPGEAPLNRYNVSICRWLLIPVLRNTILFELGNFNGIFPSARYSEYRNPPWSEARYKKNDFYWHVLAARFAFVVVFQNIVSLVTLIIDWLIPDISRKLKDEMKKEVFLTNEIIIKQERERAKEQKGKSPKISERRKLDRSMSLVQRRHTGDWHEAKLDDSSHVDTQV